MSASSSGRSRVGFIPAHDRVAAPSSSSASRFHTLAAATPIGVFETDVCGRLVYANPRAQELWEVDDLEHLLGHRWIERVHPDDRAALATAWEAAIAARVEFTHEYRLVPRPGVVRHIRAHAVPIADGSGVTVGTVEDVTDQRAAEAELRRQAITVSLLTDGVVVTDMTGVVVDWNEGAERIFGYARHEVVGRHSTVLYEPDVAAQQSAAIVAALNGPEGRWSGAIRFRRPDGTSGVTETSVAGLHDAQGRRIGGIAVNRDVTERVRAQSALRASEERYRLLIEASHEGICEVDASGAITYANERLAHMLGCPVAELSGRSLFDFMDPATADAARARFARRRRGVSVVDELPLRRRDGAVVWTRKSASPTFDEAGAFTGAMFMLGDITDRYVAQQRLVESERHFRALTEQSSELLCVIDGEARITYANPACAGLLGYRFGEAIGRSAFDFVHQDDVARVRLEFQELLAEPGALLSTEYCVPRTDGMPCVLEVVARNLLHDPAVRGIVINAHDVTARRAADRELRRQKEMLQTVLEHLPAMVVVFDAAGVPLLANREWERVSGWSLADMRTQDVLTAIYPDPDDRARVDASVGRASGAWSEYRMRARDGTVRDAAWATVRHSDGARVCIGQDTTERHHLERQFRQAQKMDAIGRLAGGVAHDFNNLLSVIASYAGMVLADVDATSTVGADLREIQRAVDRGGALTRQLLAFSRKQVLQPRVLDLAEVVDGTQGMLRRLIGEDVAIAIVAAERPLPVKADRGQLEQVLVNLAVNARDAMPRGGTLRIELDATTVDAEQARRWNAGVAGDVVRLRVVDTGIGMDEPTRSRVFEPFFTTKPVGEGTGLGLATVYGIVKQSGGCIGVESEPGRGATFTILLPRVASVPTGASAGEAAVPVARARGGTVLLVEDEAALRAVSRRLLEQSGYAVIDAPDGEAALSLVAMYTGAVDLVISDVVMPRMSGQQLVDRLAPRLGRVPVLFMSGYAMEAVERHGELRPGAMFLSKPFTQRQFLDAVAEAVASGSRERAGA